MAEAFGPRAHFVGLASRLVASTLIAALVITTGTLHRFWELVGPARNANQAVACAQLGLIAGLLFYVISGSRVWAVRAL